MQGAGCAERVWVIGGRLKKSCNLVINDFDSFIRSGDLVEATESMSAP